jgi:hypothetical protein
MSRTNHRGKDDQAQEECKNARRHGGHAIAASRFMSMKKWVPNHVSDQMMEGPRNWREGELR